MRLRIIRISLGGVGLMSKGCLLFAVFVFTGSTAVATDADTEALRAEVSAMKQAYEGRIATLEAEVHELRANGVPQQRSAEQRVNDAMGKNEPGVAIAATVRTNNTVQGSTAIRLGGYSEFTYIDRQTRTPEFDQLRTVLELSARIHERISFYTEFEFEHGAVIAGPEETQGEIELEQAYVDYNIDKALNFRAGMMLVPVGHYNLYHEGFVNNLVDRPLVNRRIIPTTWFEEGLGFYGKPIDNSVLGLSYEAYMYNPAMTGGVDPIAGFRDIHNEGKSPNSDQKAAAARLVFEPARKFKNIADTFEFGLSGFVSGFGGFKGADENGDPIRFSPGRLYVTAADVTWERKNIGFRGEAALAHSDVGINDTGHKQTAFGYYAEAYYKFWPCFLNSSPFGKFKDPKLVAALRYDYVDLNQEADATPSIQRVTAGIGYRPVPRTVIKFDYQFDWQGSGLRDFDGSETGTNKHTRAFLFSVSTGF
jgi:hypothetical protein